jgi:hypothetical protein
MSEPAGIHIFSLQEARKTLPLIRPIVQDVTDCHQALREHLEGVRNQVLTDQNSPPDPSMENTSPKLREYREDLKEYVHEIYDLGAEIHDFDRGRIDFPARLGHRVVYLCWDLADDDILYWHDTYAACHKRQSIDDEDFD